MKCSYISNNNFFVTLAFIVVIGGAGGCSVATPPALNEARNSYQQAEKNPNITGNAAVALRDAQQALNRAERDWEQNRDQEEVEHLAYLTKQRVEIAQGIAERDIAQKDIERLSEERQKVIIEAREREVLRTRKEAEARAQEAERAERQALAAQLQAKNAQEEALAQAREAEQARKSAAQNQAEAKARAQEAERAGRQALAAQLQAKNAQEEALAQAREAEQARKSAAQSQAEAEAARKQAEAAAAKNKELEANLQALQAKVKQTDRGLVLTLGDVLFEFNKAELKAGALRNLYPLVSFLKENSSRSLVIEGHTDSVGSESYNLELSQRRAEAVRRFLIENGIAQDRVTARGLGEAYPVASNNTEPGRQMNRRVEIVISNETQARPPDK